MALEAKEKGLGNAASSLAKQPKTQLAAERKRVFSWEKDGRTEEKRRVGPGKPVKITKWEKIEINKCSRGKV